MSRDVVIPAKRVKLPHQSINHSIKITQAFRGAISVQYPGGVAAVKSFPSQMPEDNDLNVSISSAFEWI